MLLSVKPVYTNSAKVNTLLQQTSLSLNAFISSKYETVTIVKMKILIFYCPDMFV